MPKPPKPGEKPSPAFQAHLDANAAKQKAYSRRRALWARRIGRPYAGCELDVQPGEIDAGFDGDG